MYAGYDRAVRTRHVGTRRATGRPGTGNHIACLRLVGVRRDVVDIGFRRWHIVGYRQGKRCGGKIAIAVAHGYRDRIGRGRVCTVVDQRVAITDFASRNAGDRDYAKRGCDCLADLGNRLAIDGYFIGQVDRLELDDAGHRLRIR